MFPQESDLSVSNQQSAPVHSLRLLLSSNVGENIQKNREREKKNPPIVKNLPEITANRAESFIPNESGRLAAAAC